MPVSQCEHQTTWSWTAPVSQSGHGPCGTMLHGCRNPTMYPNTRRIRFAAANTRICGAGGSTREDSPACGCVSRARRESRSRRSPARPDAERRERSPERRHGSYERCRILVCAQCWGTYLDGACCAVAAPAARARWPVRATPIRSFISDAPDLIRQPNVEVCACAFDQTPPI